MPPAGRRARGQHIGKTPGGRLIPSDKHQGRIRDGLGQGPARADRYPRRAAPNGLIRTPCDDGARLAERRKYSALGAQTTYASLAGDFGDAGLPPWLLSDAAAS